MPNKLKLAKVIPRKVTILSHKIIVLFHSCPYFTKFFEKLMAKRLKGFSAANSILYNNQFAFRQTFSTVIALIDVTDEIYSIAIWNKRSKNFDKRPNRRQNILRRRKIVAK